MLRSLVISRYPTHQQGKAGKENVLILCDIDRDGADSDSDRARRGGDACVHTNIGLHIYGDRKSVV